MRRFRVLAIGRELHAMTGSWVDVIFVEGIRACSCESICALSFMDCRLNAVA